MSPVVSHTPSSCPFSYVVDDEKYGDEGNQAVYPRSQEDVVFPEVATPWYTQVVLSVVNGEEAIRAASRSRMA